MCVTTSTRFNRQLNFEHETHNIRSSLKPFIQRTFKSSMPLLNTRRYTVIYFRMLTKCDTFTLYVYQLNPINKSQPN